MNIWSFLAKLEWGSVPDWFEALGTVGSLLLLGMGLLREIRIRRETQVEELAMQARLIHTAATRDGRVLEVRVTNSSLAPVLDVALAAIADDGVTTLAVDTARGPFHQIGAHRSENFYLTLMNSNMSRMPSPIEIEITFTDQNGARWVRRGSQQPTRAPGDR